MTVKADRVPVEQLQEALERSGMTPSQVGKALEWWNGKAPDGSRVERMLGLRKWPGRDGHPGYWQQTVQYDKAVELVLAMGLDPVDAGV